MKEINMNRLQLKIEENFSLTRKEKQTSFGGSSSIWKDLTYGTKSANGKLGEARCCRDGNDLLVQSEEDTGKVGIHSWHSLRFSYSTPSACFSILKIECYLFILVKKIIQSKNKRVITSNFESYKSFLQRDTMKRS